MKKSEIVRNMIATAKAQNISADELVKAVMEDLGFQRQLARAYVKNNWDKVGTTAAAKVEETATVAAEADDAADDVCTSDSVEFDELEDEALSEDEMAELAGIDVTQLHEEM